MVHIGFTATTISASIIIMAVTRLLVEIPAGILADRRSRKGVLVAACVSLTLASLLFGLSQSIPLYIMVGVIFSIYFALHSGLYEAIVYDLLIEENGSREGYEKYVGYATLINSVGLVVSSLLGGIIADQLGLRTAYFLSVPFGILSVVTLLAFREPQLHKAEVHTHLVEHTRETFRIVMRKGYIAWLVGALITSALLFNMLLEVDQFWPLALHMPTVWYGPLNALLLLGFGIGGPLAALFKQSCVARNVAIGIGFIAVCLLLIKHMAVIAIAQTAIIAVYMALYVVILGALQDQLPSRLRSGAASVVGTLSGVVLIPLVFCFGIVTQQRSVFMAAYLLIPISIIATVSIFVTFQHKEHI